MSRTKGARNGDHIERRAELVRRLRQCLAGRDDGQPSLRDLAAAAGVSTATLKHHFRDRNGIVAAVLIDGGAAGAPYLALASEPSGPLATSIRDYLRFAMVGHLQGVGALHTVGLTEGLGHPAQGPAYVHNILEPTLAALERRLAVHVERGEMRPVDVRHAALALLAPVLVAQLHQRELGGAECRPLDVEAFIDAHAEAFVRGYRTADQR